MSVKRHMECRLCVCGRNTGNNICCYVSEISRTLTLCTKLNEGLDFQHKCRLKVPSHVICQFSVSKWVVKLLLKLLLLKFMSSNTLTDQLVTNAAHKVNHFR